MSTVVNAMALAAIVLGPVALAATLASRAPRGGRPGWHLDQFRFAAPMAGRLFGEDADLRRIEHDVDAIRTRFEVRPSWPSSGDAGERR
jgi:hypothetical protein